MANIVNYLTQVLSSANVQPSVTVKPVAQSSNPFSHNPFVSMKDTGSSYAKNQPVKGGYFAGYYNNKPNIVGQRLFLEV